MLATRVPIRKLCKLKKIVPSVLKLLVWVINDPTGIGIVTNKELSRKPI